MESRAKRETAREEQTRAQDADIANPAPVSNVGDGAMLSCAETAAAEKNARTMDATAAANLTCAIGEAFREKRNKTRETGFQEENVCFLKVD